MEKEKEKLRAKLLSIQRVNLLAISAQLSIPNGDQLSQDELINAMSEKILSKLLTRAQSGSGSQEEIVTKIAKLLEHLLNAMDGRDNVPSTTPKDPFLSSLFYNDVSLCFVCGQIAVTSTSTTILTCHRECGGKCHESCHPWRVPELGPFECPACILLTMDPLHPVVSVLYPPSFLQPTATYPLRMTDLPASVGAFEFRCLKLDGTHFTETTLPDKGTLAFNGHQVKEFKPLSQQSSLKKRRDEKPILWASDRPDPAAGNSSAASNVKVPAEFDAMFAKSTHISGNIVAESLRLGQDATGGVPSSGGGIVPAKGWIQIEWQACHDDKNTKAGAGDVRYVFCVVAIEKLSSKELVRRVRLQSDQKHPTPADIEYLEASPQAVEQKFAQIEAIKAANSPGGDVVGEMEQSLCKVSLKDTSTMEWMKCPGKGVNCNHLQAFCLDSFSFLMERHHTRPWKCPICKGRANSLILDRLQDAVLAEARKRQKEYNCVYLRESEVILELGNENDSTIEGVQPKATSQKSRGSSTSVELVSPDPPKRKGNKRGNSDQISTAPSSPGDINSQNNVLGIKQITGQVGPHSLITQKPSLDNGSRERVSQETDPARSGLNKFPVRYVSQSAQKPVDHQPHSSLETQLQYLMREPTLSISETPPYPRSTTQLSQVQEKLSKLVPEIMISEEQVPDLLAQMSINIPGATPSSAGDDLEETRQPTHSLEGIFKNIGGPYIRFLQSQIDTCLKSLAQDEDYLYRPQDYSEEFPPPIPSRNNQRKWPRGYLEWEQKILRRAEQEKRLSEYIEDLWVYSHKLKDIRLGKRTEEHSAERSLAGSNKSN